MTSRDQTTKVHDLCVTLAEIVIFRQKYADSDDLGGHLLVYGLITKFHW